MSYVISETTILNALLAFLLVGGVVSILAGRTLVAGVCFLALSLAIYYREKRI